MSGRAPHAPGGSVVLAFPGRRRQARRLISLAELMDALEGSERWWRYRLEEGLPRLKRGRRLRFDLDEVEA